MDLVVDNGKPVEPSKPQKAMAAVTRDKKLTIVLSHEDVQAMIGNKIYQESPWMKDYKAFTFKHNPSDNTYTLEYLK